MTLDADTRTADSIGGSAVIASLSPDERQTWRLTGKLPESTTITESKDVLGDLQVVEDADPTPAPPVEQAVSTETKPDAASEPAKTDPKPKNAETRLAELLEERGRERAELAQLRREMDELRKTGKPDAVAAPSSAPVLADVLRSPDISKPKLSDTAFFETFPDATYGVYAEYVARYAVAEDRASVTRTTANQARVQEWNRKIGVELKDNPQFWESVHPKVAQSLTPSDQLPANTPPTRLNDLADEVVDSTHSVALLKKLSAQPELLDQVAACPSKSAVAKLVGRWESAIESSAVPAVETPAVPPKKTVSEAPPVPDVLGTKAQLAPDPVAAALASGDFARYRREQNARELAEA